METTLVRYSDNSESTLGLLFVEEDFESYTLEDEAREEKVQGDTCIPTGRYQILFREEPTPLTRKYQNKFDWFTFHLELQDVPNFKYIYIHIGNHDGNTDGCILVGDTANDNTEQDGWIGSSTVAFESFYKKVKPALENGEEVFITVKQIEL